MARQRKQPNPYHRLALSGSAALCLCWPHADAQTSESITITGRGNATPAVSGFADQPLARSPLQGGMFGREQLADSGVATLGGLTRLDASVGDAYNAEGYWSNLAVRGYALDNRYNYRRDGLPINAETSLALDNKDRIELFKGTSGIQAGTSAPGGLINLVVKRPTGKVRSASIEARQAGSLLAAVDVGDRTGPDGAIGLRLNAAYEHLDPQARDSEGRRWLLALAGDWQLGPDTLIEAEVEDSRRRQPSVAGFSLLGDKLPDAQTTDPRVNLNRQPWGQPVELNGTTASLRWQQRLAEDWRFTAHATTQRLKSNDRTAFPYGNYDAGYGCDPCDRFARDGSFSYWQYVSDNERRTSDAVDLSLSGQASTAGIEHKLQFGVLQTRYRGHVEDQVFDLARDPSGNGEVGYGHIDGSRDTLPSFGFPTANTNRRESSTEWYLRDVVQVASDWQLWAGLRHTRIDRQSELTSPDGEGSLRATHYKQNETTPWLALAWSVADSALVYASWGEGLETEVVPNRVSYANRGQALPALKSRQVEIGLRHGGDHHDASIAAFDIDRPQAADFETCDAGKNCTTRRQIDGNARHRGIEAQAALRLGAWAWQASLMWLDAERRGSVRPEVNGLRPSNVARGSARVGAGYRVSAVPGLELQAALAAEGDRMVLPDDNRLRIPGWARLDLGARWSQRIDNTTLTWRLGVDNVADRRAWKESPYQFGHVYLYPLEPRTWRGSVAAAF